MVARMQYFFLFFNALEVIRMLIGPAMGIERMNPANKPTSEIVIKLSNIEANYLGKTFFLIIWLAFSRSEAVSISVQ